MTNKLYDALKFVAQILLPALATLYAALAAIWGWGYSEAIVGSISAVDVFLGAILAYASKKYQQGGGE